VERLALSVWLTVVAGTLAGCADDDQVALPATFPRLPVPAGNMLTEARVELGKRLFYDKPVSGTGAVACAVCQLAGWFSSTARGGKAAAPALRFVPPQPDVRGCGRRL